MSFKDWYEKNRVRLNAARRKRYSEDASYRDKVLKNTRRWRKEDAKRRAALPPKPKTIFTIGEAAELIGCMDKTIRTIEKAGLIPTTSDGVHHRRFNNKQIKLIERIVKFRKDVHYKNPKYEPGLVKLAERAQAQWN